MNPIGDGDIFDVGYKGKGGDVYESEFLMFSAKLE